MISFLLTLLWQTIDAGDAMCSNVSTLSIHLNKNFSPQTFHFVDTSLLGNIFLFKHHSISVFQNSNKLRPENIRFSNIYIWLFVLLFHSKIQTNVSIVGLVSLDWLSVFCQKSSCAIRDEIRSRLETTSLIFLRCWEINKK